jgi:ABC-2 type transport system ATP-binding protein
MEIIRVEKLSKNYKALKALDEVSLSIKEGELFGLLGVNGAGKTTLIRILSGLAKKSGGDAVVDGHPLSEIDEIKKIIDISPQETSVAMNLTVKENLSFFESLYGSHDEEYFNKIVDSFSFKEILNKRAKTLSGGWQRRLSIAVALISKPKILFLDEPTLGLDVLIRRELWKIIKSLKGKTTIVLTSHYLEEIEALCDRVAILSSGHLLDIGTVEEIKEHTNVNSFEDAFVKIVGGDIK